MDSFKRKINISLITYVQLMRNIIGGIGVKVLISGGAWKVVQCMKSSDAKTSQLPSEIVF